MKKKFKISICITISVIGLVLVCFGLFFMDLCDVFGFHKREMLNYYSNNQNYYFASGIISCVDVINDDGCVLCIQNIKYEKETLTENNGRFAIRYLNASELWEVWTPEVGQNITFCSSKRIFYDGYIEPIVSIFYEKEIMSFEIGKAKLIEWISS